MDICITEFQSKDAFHFIPVHSCLSDIADVCVGEAT